MRPRKRPRNRRVFSSASSGTCDEISKHVWEYCDDFEYEWKCGEQGSYPIPLHNDPNPHNQIHTHLLYHSKRGRTFLHQPTTPLNPPSCNLRDPSHPNGAEVPTPAWHRTLHPPDPLLLRPPPKTRLSVLLLLPAPPSHQSESIPFRPAISARP
jgi:hypothetical protein